MKKFYSILALAFMCMVGVANAQTVKSVEFVARSSSATSIEKDGITFSLKNAVREGVRGDHWEPAYVIDKEASKNENTRAYIMWENIPDGKQIHVTEIVIFGRCYRTIGQITKHSMTAYNSYNPSNIIGVFSNEWGDGSGWETAKLGGDDFFPADGLRNDAHIVLLNGGGEAQIQTLKISYYLEDLKAVYVENENDVVFEGNWTEGEISERLENPVDGLNPDEIGIVDITGAETTGRGEIITPNPNTLIEANEGQYNGSHNVLVDGVINNLIVVDPLMAGYNPQDGTGYESKCTWNLKREGLVAAKASYTRPMTNKYATVAIPFGYATSEINAQVEEITDMDLLEGKIVTNKIEADGVAAGDAVIVWANGDIEINAENVDVVTAPRTGAILNGTFAEMEIGAGQYAIAMDQFWHAGDAERGSMTVKPFRAWFGRPAASDNENAAKVLSIVSADATAIKNVETITTDAPAYNLQGVRVAPNAKGFVIVNGKKYFNK